MQMPIPAVLMDRFEIMDLKTMVKPPDCVKDALSLLRHCCLGIGRKKPQRNGAKLMMLLFNWKTEHIRLLTEARDPNAITLEVALGARALMEKYTHHDVHVKSIGAGKMYNWNIAVIEVVLARFSEEDISRTKPRTKEHVDS